MERTFPFVSTGRIFGTLKVQSHAPGAETAPHSQAPRTRTQPPDRWTLIEAKWAAMTKRALSGTCHPAADPLPPSVLVSLPDEQRQDAKHGVARSELAKSNK